MPEAEFVPDISWEALSEGAYEVHWLPRNNILGHFCKGILVAKVGRVLGGPSQDVFWVQLVHRIRSRQIKRGNCPFAPIFYRHAGVSRTVPLLDLQSDDRMAILAAIHEAYKLATVPGYKQQYIQSEQFQLNLQG